MDPLRKELVKRLNENSQARWLQFEISNLRRTFGVAPDDVAIKTETGARGHSLADTVENLDYVVAALIGISLDNIRSQFKGYKKDASDEDLYYDYFWTEMEGIRFVTDEELGIKAV